MRNGKFDCSRFHAALDAERQSRHLTWKQVAEETGVSASTLTRMAQGRRPDVDGLVSLTAWAGLRAEEFVVGAEPAEPRPEPSTLAIISTHLRADRNLSAQDAEMLEELIQVAYERMRQRKE